MHSVQDLSKVDLGSQIGDSRDFSVFEPPEE